MSLPNKVHTSRHNTWVLVFLFAFELVCNSFIQSGSLVQFGLNLASKLTSTMSFLRYMKCTPAPTTIVLDKDHLMTQVGNVRITYSLNGRIAWIIPAIGSVDNWNHDHEVLAMCAAASNMKRSQKAKHVVHTDNKETPYLTNMRRQGVFEYRESFPAWNCTAGGYIADLDKVLQFCQDQDFVQV